MGLQQRNGNVPSAVRLSKEADKLRRDLWLGLAQRDTLQQCLQEKHALVCSSILVFMTQRYIKPYDIATCKSQGLPCWDPVSSELYIDKAFIYKKHPNSTAHLYNIGAVLRLLQVVLLGEQRYDGFGQLDLLLLLL